jgi:hypothetical protein
MGKTIVKIHITHLFIWTITTKYLSEQISKVCKMDRTCFSIIICLLHLVTRIYNRIVSKTETRPLELPVRTG